MADIPGFKTLRLLAQQPVAVTDLLRMAAIGNQRLEKRYVLELGFEDGSVINVPLTRELHDHIKGRMLRQPGVAVEERMAARGALAATGEAKTVTEEILPLDASGKDVYEALRRVADGPAAAGTDHPALPDKKEPSDGST